jgi:Putative DNA-binding domain
MNPAVDKEALRQRMLLRMLWADAGPDVLSGWLRDARPRASRGLQAYRAHAGALAERALAAAYPTVAQLVGDESFAALARALWFAQPPQHGDIAQWGEGLAAFIEAAPQLAEEPYLADVARLDWAVHRAEQAAERGPVLGLEQLAQADPAWLRLRLAEGLALCASAHPVASIWQAHRSSAEDRFAGVRAAFAAGRGEHALVWRDGFQARVQALPDADARFMQALLQAQPLDAALDAAGTGFAFEHWLPRALQCGWLAAVEFQPGDTAA